MPGGMKVDDDGLITDFADESAENENDFPEIEKDPDELELDHFEDEHSEETDDQPDNPDTDQDTDTPDTEPENSDQDKDDTDWKARYKELQSKFTKTSQENAELKRLGDRLKAVEDKTADPPPKKLDDYTDEELAEIAVNEPKKYADLIKQDLADKQKETESQAAEAQAAEQEQEEALGLMLDTLDELGMKPPENVEQDSPEFQDFYKNVLTVQKTMDKLGFTKFSKESITLAYQAAFPIEAAKRNFDKFNAGGGGDPQHSTKGDAQNNTVDIPGLDKSRLNDPEYYKELAMSDDGNKILDQLIPGNASQYLH